MTSPTSEALADVRAWQKERNTMRLSARRVTENDAKDKACPFKVDGFHCIATACMAWAWDPPEPPRLYRLSVLATISDEEAKTIKRPPYVPAWWPLYLDEYGTWSWREPDADFDARRAQNEREWPEKRLGYCALMRGSNA